MNRPAHALLLAMGLALGLPSVVLAAGDVPPDEAEWIWTPAHARGEAPEGDCYFRKVFTLDGRVDEAQIEITADNQYELFVNGRSVGEGSDWRELDHYDLTDRIEDGFNTIAIRVTNSDAGAAGLVARLHVTMTTGERIRLSTDSSWKATVREFSGWMERTYNETHWVAAQSFGQLGAALPWGDEVVRAGLGARFELHDPAFRVEQVLDDELVGSLIAMVFDHRGDVLAAQEGGPILRLTDGDRDGRPDQVEVFCDEMKNVQGMLPLGRQVLAIGEGPRGGGLYALRLEEGEPSVEEVKPLLLFGGSSAEHGAHALRLGRDGMVYFVMGNFAGLASAPQSDTPYQKFYEGDVVTPRYEDPRGHAVGVKTPGGTIIRTDPAGKRVEYFASGLRNPYDIAIDRDGEIYTFDADMEWDVGLPWYRPTRFNQITAGGEFGWRSGWAKWPDYFVDSLPGIGDVGPGSPTGVEFYNHFMFPIRYQGAMFAADWAEGQIFVVRFEDNGASRRARHEVFLTGNPLNVTDLAVGQDGALWFCTGGRGTAGGLYRIEYTGRVPAEVRDLGKGIERAIKQPQLDAPWSQSQIASVRKQLDARWAPALKEIARSPRRKSNDRIRALDLMQLYGPRPSTGLLLELSNDEDESVRSRVIYLMGTKTNTVDEEAVHRALLAALEDSSPRVRRIACEAMVRARVTGGIPQLVGLLADEDRWVAYAARRALERQPIADWRDEVLDAVDVRRFVRGSIAIMITDPNESSAVKMLDRAKRLIQGDVDDPRYPEGFISDADFLDLLRAAQVAIANGRLAPQQCREFAAELIKEYPSTDADMNRELVRLLVFAQQPDAAARFAARLEDDTVSVAEKLHVAAYASRLTAGWDREAKLAVIYFYDQARGFEGGHSLAAYIDRFETAFLKQLNVAEQQQLLSAAADWPHAALCLLSGLEEIPGGDFLHRLQLLDSEIADAEGDPAARLRVGIAAILGQSGETSSLAHLRNVYAEYPSRRATVAMALTAHPHGENWPILVDSLRAVEGAAASEVVATLTRIDRAPQDAVAYRRLILLGLRSSDRPRELCLKLLAHWAGDVERASALDDPAARLAAWQQWYANKFPDAPAAELPVEDRPNKWSLDELLSHLEAAGPTAGDPDRGAIVYSKAQCSKCHRFSSMGDPDAFGPDLTSVARRFDTREILEAVIYPSHTVSDQYASQVVLVNGRQHVGIVTPDGEGMIYVHDQDGNKRRFAREDVEEIVPSDLSAMPEGLFNPLTLDDIVDLFAYLRSTSRVARGPAKQPR